MTVAKELSRIKNIRLLDNHTILDIVREYIPAFTRESIQVARDFRMQLFVGAAKYNSGDIITTLAGGSPGNLQWIMDFTQRIESENGEVIFVNLICNRKEQLRRIKDPARNQNKVVTEEQLEVFLQKDYFKGHPNRTHIIIDNTELTPEMCAIEISKIL